MMTFKEFKTCNLAHARALKFYDNVAELFSDEEMGRWEKSIRTQEILSRLAYETYQIGLNDGRNEVHAKFNNVLFEVGMDQLDILGLFDDGNNFDSDPQNQFTDSK